MRKLIFDKGVDGRYGYTLPQTAIDEYNPDSIPSNLLRNEKYSAPGLNEKDVAEHFNGLLSNNKCCGGYVQSIIDDAARYDGFTGIHPYQLADAGQGAFELLFTLRHMLCDMFGMDMFSLGAVSGVQAMQAALLMARAYFADKKECRGKVIVGASLCGCMGRIACDMGFTVENIDEADYADKLDDTVAAVILDGNNTMNIAETIEKIHSAGALAIADGKRMKRLCGISRPGDMGFDVVFFNLEDMFTISDVKGSDAGFAVGVKESLVDYVPTPMVEMDDLEQYYFDYNRPKSVGKMNEFYGNFTAWIKTLGVILSLGYEGLVNVSKAVALNTAYNAKKCGCDCVVSESVEFGVDN